MTRRRLVPNAEIKRVLDIVRAKRLSDDEGEGG
jgi:hypothetical protein